MVGSKTIIWVGAFALLGLWVACGPQPASLGTPEVGKVLDYRATLAQWTRTYRLYEDFESRVVARATYYSQTFVAAYLQEYDRIYQPVNADRQALRSRFENQQMRSECFFVSFFAGNRDWNDLALSGSTWRIYLETAKGARLAARSVQQLERKLVEQKHFFPYHDEFSEAYLVCFDRYPEVEAVRGLPRAVLSSDVGSFALSFRSPVGHFRLEWQVKE